LRNQLKAGPQSGHLTSQKSECQAARLRLCRLIGSVCLNRRRTRRDGPSVQEAATGGLRATSLRRLTQNQWYANRCQAGECPRLVSNAVWMATGGDSAIASDGCRLVGSHRFQPLEIGLLMADR